MTDGLHSVAPHHLPAFISGPHEGDPLYVMTSVMLLAAVIGIGVLFFTLHSLPDRMGHKKLQFEIVAVLCLLSLFTHNHAFWVAALLLALVDLPDFTTPLKRMAGALEKLSGSESPLEATADEHGQNRAPPGPALPQKPPKALSSPTSIAPAKRV